MIYKICINIIEFWIKVDYNVRDFFECSSTFFFKNSKWDALKKKKKTWKFFESQILQTKKKKKNSKRSGRSRSSDVKKSMFKENLKKYFFSVKKKILPKEKQECVRSNLWRVAF